MPRNELGDLKIDSLAVMGQRAKVTGSRQHGGEAVEGQSWGISSFKSIQRIIGAVGPAPVLAALRAGDSGWWNVWRRLTPRRLRPDSAVTHAIPGSRGESAAEKEVGGSETRA
jgi:hypothetical protein